MQAIVLNPDAVIRRNKDTEMEITRHVPRAAISEAGALGSNRKKHLERQVGAKLLS